MGITYVTLFVDNKFLCNEINPFHLSNSITVIFSFISVSSSILRAVLVALIVYIFSLKLFYCIFMRNKPFRNFQNF